MIISVSDMFEMIGSVSVKFDLIDLVCDEIGI
jgi:hypothetical protein